MPLASRKIKNKSVTIDREIGEATVVVVLHEKRRDEIKTTVTARDIIPFVKREGIEIIDIIKNDQISNRYGESTGTWIFKIPTIDPENSTTTILKRRNNKKKRKIVEEDWTKGPED